MLKTTKSLSLNYENYDISGTPEWWIWMAPCVGEQFSMGVLCFCISCKCNTDCPLFQTVFSRMFVEQRTLGYRDSVSLWSKGQACLLLITKDSGFLNSGFLYCEATHCVGKYHLAFSALPCGNRGLGKLAPKCWYSDYCLYSFSIVAVKKLPQS